MQSWASAILSNQWFGHGAPRSRYESISCRRSEESNIRIGAEPRTQSHSIQCNEIKLGERDFTRKKIYVIFLTRLLILYAFHCAIFFCTGAEPRARLHCGWSISTSRSGIYNEKCRWHVSSQRPGFTPLERRRRQRKQVKPRAGIFFCLRHIRWIEVAHHAFSAPLTSKVETTETSLGSRGGEGGRRLWRLSCHRPQPSSPNSPSWRIMLT